MGRFFSFSVFLKAARVRGKFRTPALNLGHIWCAAAQDHEGLMSLLRESTYRARAEDTAFAELGQQPDVVVAQLHDRFDLHPIQTVNVDPGLQLGRLTLAPRAIYPTVILILDNPAARSHGDRNLLAWS